MHDIEKLIVLYGEQYRRLIEDAINWLATREPVWGVTVDRDDFVAELVRHYK